MEQAANIQTAIVQRACKGDAAARAWLYQQYSKAMFNICIRMTGDRASAEDILQDAFILAFSKLEQLKEANQFGGWVKRIVVNECIRQMKKNMHWQVLDTNYDEAVQDEPNAWWKTVDMQIIHQEIKALPQGCRQVFNLYVIEDYSHKEIASALSISESTSKSQYQRAKQILKERINKYVAIHG